MYSKQVVMIMIDIKLKVLKAENIHYNYQTL